MVSYKSFFQRLTVSNSEKCLSQSNNSVHYQETIVFIIDKQLLFFIAVKLKK